MTKVRNRLFESQLMHIKFIRAEEETTIIDSDAEAPTTTKQKRGKKKRKDDDEDDIAAELEQMRLEEEGGKTINGEHTASNNASDTPTVDKKMKVSL